MNTFPIEKTGRNRKAPTEAEMINLLLSGTLSDPPLSIIGSEKPFTPPPGAHYDAIIDVTWRDKRAQYIVECKSSNTPKMVEMAALQARSAGEASGLLPLVYVPYLSNESLQILEKKEVSGLDRCGNGLLIAPDFCIRRSGEPTQFKDSRPIRNPFRGDSSVFARTFLLCPEFESLNQIWSYQRETTLDGSPSRSSLRGLMTEAANVLTLSTASKVVSALLEELIVTREAGKIRLIDARRLLDLLHDGGREPKRRSLVGKSHIGLSEIWTRLGSAREVSEFRSVVTGLGSAPHYGVLSDAEKLSLYVDDIDKAATLLEVQPGRPFANIELFEERKNVVYFDARGEGHFRWASPIQTWLELSSGGPRERQAAEVLEALLLAGKASTL